MSEPTSNVHPDDLNPGYWIWYWGWHFLHHPVIAWRGFRKWREDGS